MSLGDFNRDRRKTRKCLPCYNKTRPFRPSNGQHQNIMHEGYVFVYKPEHHRATNKGYVKRAVLIAEEKLGRELTDCDFIHHINGKKDDDALENIQVLTNSEHVRLHAKERTYNRTLTGQFSASHPIRSTPDESQ